MSLKTTFQTIGDNLKTNLINRDISIDESVGFNTILNKIFDLMDTKVDSSETVIMTVTFIDDTTKTYIIYGEEDV